MRFYSAQYRVLKQDRKTLTGALSAIFLLIAGSSYAESSSKPSGPSGPGSIAIASAAPLATQAGINIMNQGGNAFDAAVAVSAMLAVVEPYSSGIGGGGFWLLHRASDGKNIMVDGRERAPLDATETMYQDTQGEIVKGLSVNGPLAAGIPGEPAALAHIAEKYGMLPLSTTLSPAIAVAKSGFKVDKKYQAMARFRQKTMARWSDSSILLLHQGETPEIGHTIIQNDLANTLQALADRGHAGFYNGEIADQLITSVRAEGGIWSAADLADYQVIEREPIQFSYADKTIISAAPPSSGGIALATMLNILSAYALEDKSEAEQTHLIVEAMRRAYRDRAEYLGDPDFINIPMKRLINADYAAGLRASIRSDQATQSKDLPDVVYDTSGHHTTHFSVLDREGNRVSATLSINYPFGSGFIATGTGVLLNDEMDDFSSKPGTPNVYGLIGAKANAIAPGKRPLSSMSPSFVESKDSVAILGTPGGSRIISMVLLGILEAEKNIDPLAWVSRPRFHHQYLPDVILHEANAFSEESRNRLQKMGHQLKQRSTYGNMQAIYWDKTNNQVSAASDPRGVGASIVE